MSCLASSCIPRLWNWKITRFHQLDPVISCFVAAVFPVLGGSFHWILSKFAWCDFVVTIFPVGRSRGIKDGDRLTCTWPRVCSLIDIKHSPVMTAFPVFITDSRAASALLFDFWKVDPIKGTLYQYVGRRTRDKVGHLHYTTAPITMFCERVLQMKQ